MRPTNSMNTDKPPKGVTARKVSHSLIFPPPNNGLNSCQSFCSSAWEKCFCTTHSLIAAWNRTSLLLDHSTSVFGLNPLKSLRRTTRSFERLREILRLNYMTGAEVDLR